MRMWMTFVDEQEFKMKTNGTETMIGGIETRGPGPLCVRGPGLISGGEFYISTTFYQQP